MRGNQLKFDQKVPKIAFKGCNALQNSENSSALFTVLSPDRPWFAFSSHFGTQVIKPLFQASSLNHFFFNIYFVNRFLKYIIFAKSSTRLELICWTIFSSHRYHSVPQIQFVSEPNCCFITRKIVIQESKIHHWSRPPNRPRVASGGQVSKHRIRK